ncbi:conserved hypothetical protein [Leishmania major strain Friedlin]|uniref:RRM domain-containing protein n=1 Tax=Leishmania major TaxID=5664 RepID=Q4QJ91_LEIMA|nr:conserved hypothetical protein [Leishmania major strain Friedlin]CAG9568291.1 hypothetical_protein_-_conserved [Leishmania major strain Friedlin]CAJ02031.1 conserved hypothetical protein [Leishmania major strain Friedlin]|eukprot:XP_001687588.1 conserved hypothetical protein [Leishmania major strain Friedlin]
MDTTTKRLPSFVVTSSNDATFTKPATPAKTGSSITLNPDAQEFRVTPAFAGTLFSMPSAAASAPPPQRWFQPTMDFSTRPTAGNNGTSQSSSSPPPASPSASAASDAMDNRQLVELTEAYMHQLYDRKCNDEKLHMVSVFHLHPRTTDKQLSRIFFPTGASAAEVLEPRMMPESLAKAFLAVRQRAGVVFFTRKDFAMVGVEKVHDFVPHGQHQPLVVRYCGPDHEATPLSGSPLPPRSQSSDPLRGDALSSAKATSPRPSDRPTPPQSRHRDASNPSDVFPASIVAVPPLSAGLESIASAGTTTPALDAGASSTAAYDSIDHHFLQKYAGEQVYLVGVHNLAYGTTPKSLFKMFYPMGALNSELLPRPVSVDGKLRCSGVAVFGSKGMAMEAAEKMNDFVPHGQRRPIVARFLKRATSPAFASSAAPGNGSSTTSSAYTATAAMASTPRGSTSSPSPASGISSAAALLDSVEKQLRSKSLNDSQLAADMAALVLCAESGEAEARKLAAVLRDVLLSMRDHSTILASPLSGALRTLHSTLGIRVRTAPATPADASLSVRKGVLFLQQIGRTLMMLVADTEAARQTRIVAAVQCAYLYQYTYLPKTPLCFAATLFRNCERELREAREFLCREPNVPSSLAEEQQHRPWITLMDALHEMVSVWRSLDPRTYAQDAVREEYERFVCEFRGMDMRRSSPVTSTLSVAAVASAGGGEHHSGACTPRNDALGVPAEAVNHTYSAKGHGSSSVNASAKKSQFVTPSARPTPRRVVSKSYSTTSDWKVKQSTPLAGPNCAVPPQVMLTSPASDYTQGASEFSADSNSAGTTISSALRSLGLTPQHPSMRFNWGSRLLSAAPQPGMPPNPTVSAAAMLPATPTLSAPASTSATASAASGTPAAAATSAERSDATMTERTVYITKLPSCLSAGQVRRLLLHFGDFRKVRLCHDDKETTRIGSAEALAAHNLKFDQLCFGFVEFVESSSAKAMVEFFRNEVHTPSAFDFLRAEDVHGFDDTELNQLRNTRTSQARNPIHDQQPLDATRTQPCFFGIIQPHHTVDTYSDAITAEEVAEAVRQLHREEEGAQQQPLPMCASPFIRPAVFSTSTPYSMTVSKDVSFGSPVAATASPTGDNNYDENDGGGSVVAALQPMDAVHFPSGFPYHEVFTAAASQTGDGDGAGHHDNSAGSNGHLPSDDMDLYGSCAPVIVEEEEDEVEGLQEYQVQQILQLLS